MSGKTVVVGGGVAGMATAIGLARAGHEVTLVERDRQPGPIGINDAFDRWDRPSIPQSRQPHTFQARATSMLSKLAPDVLDDLISAGIESTSFGLELVPESEREPEDGELRCLLCRRLPFDLALRRAVEREPLVSIRSGAVVRSVRVEGRRFRAAVLDDGHELEAEWLVDAAGRRSPIRDAIAAAGVTVPVPLVEPCSYTYFTRHFRLLGGTAPLWTVIGARTDIGHLTVLGFPGDAHTFAVLLGAPSEVFPPLRSLRHTEVWDRVASAVPRLRRWLGSGVSEPITDVLVMSGQTNTLRDFAVDGRAVLDNWLPVGDALCTTNPGLALGASLALTHAAAAVAAIGSGDGATRYHHAVFDEAASWYGVSAANDRARTTLLRGQELDPATRSAHDREVLFRSGVAAGGASGDIALLRANLRRLHLLDGPHDWYDDGHTRSRAVAFAAAHPPPPVEALGPTLEQLLELTSTS